MSQARILSVARLAGCGVYPRPVTVNRIETAQAVKTNHSTLIRAQKNKRLKPVCKAWSWSLEVTRSL